MSDWDKIICFDSLYKAHRRARLGKRHKKEVIEFEMHLAENIWALHYDLKYGKYEVGGYHNFMIYDPKEREIQAISYRDRIVQHSLCDNYLIPLLERHLIYDNAACRRNKGTHFALGRLTRFMTEHYKKYGRSGYFIKIDIKKYFASVDHDVLKKKLSALVPAGNIRELIFRIIDSYRREDGKGLPMGNQSSQCFALLYLDGVDRLIKEKLGVKHYLRYMDDMILLTGAEKRDAANILAKICSAILEENLTPNAKTQILAAKNGIGFLGWRFFFGENGKIVRKLSRGSKVRMIEKARMRASLTRRGRLPKGSTECSLVSYRGHLAYGDAYHFMGKIECCLKKQ